VNSLANQGPSGGSLPTAGVGDLRDVDDATFAADHTTIPIVRIVPTSFVPGPLDPGGRFWLVPLAASLAGTVAAAAARMRRRTAQRQAVAPG